MKTTRNLSVLLIALVLSVSSAVHGQGPTVIHVSPGGADSNSGAEGSPIRSLARVQECVAQNPAAKEIIFHACVYRGGFALGDVPSVDAASVPLRIHAAEGEELTPGYHVFSVLGTDAAGSVRTSDPVMVVVPNTSLDVHATQQ